MACPCPLEEANCRRWRSIVRQSRRVKARLDRRTWQDGSPRPASEMEAMLLQEIQQTAKLLLRHES